MRGEHPPEREPFWRVHDERALRRGDGTYHRDQDGRDRLFNVVDDPRERPDKGADPPGLLARLRTAWEETDAGPLPYPA